MSRGDLLVLYGSQTGTAQDVAERIWQDAKRRRFEATIHPMDDFPISQLPEQHCIVFVCSTTGQGDEPDNMRNTIRVLLRRNLPPDLLQGVRIAVLGLGDSSYMRFNFSAKKLYRRLMQLGVHAVTSLGLADDQHDLGIDGVAEPWIDSLWKQLDLLYPLPSGVLPVADHEPLPPKYIVDFTCKPHNNELRAPVKPSVGVQNFSPDRPFSATLLSNDRVTANDHFQDTRLIRLDIGGSEITYEPGDVAYVQPSNLVSSQELFLDLLTLPDLDRPFLLLPSDSSIALPNNAMLSMPCTVRQCVANLWDLQGVPKRSFFRFLAMFATNELEHEKLVELSSAEGQEELFDYCNRPRRSLVETLQDFPDTFARIPLEYLFDLLPQIRPRSFSIASSLSVHGNKLELLVAVVRYRTRLVKPRLGLCSNWLGQLSPRAKVPIWVRKGTITFPTNALNACIMVGPGTGVAPFRSFVCELDDGKNILFFGCRSKDKDFYFEDEWKLRVQNGSLRLYTAFSRDQEQKIYVQHRIRECGSQIIDILLSDTTYIFVAGNAKQMPDAVRQAFLDVLQEAGHLSVEQSESFLGAMEKGKRLQMETWSQQQLEAKKALYHEFCCRQRGFEEKSQYAQGTVPESTSVETMPKDKCLLHLLRKLWTNDYMTV